MYRIRMCVSLRYRLWSLALHFGIAPRSGSHAIQEAHLMRTNSVAAKPSADRQKHRPLDTQGASPEDLDPANPSNQGDLRLPHEHDEASTAGRDVDISSSPLPRQVIEQAASDITRGLCDSERRGIPSDVPAPGPTAENSPGGEVPAGGVDRDSTASRNEPMKNLPKPA